MAGQTVRLVGPGHAQTALCSTQVSQSRTSSAIIRIGASKAGAQTAQTGRTDPVVVETGEAGAGGQIRGVSGCRVAGQTHR